MTERTVTVDDKNYYFDIRSREKSGQFSPGVFFNLVFPDGSTVNIPPECINQSLEGNWFKVDGVRYNVIDKITRTIIKNGYFVHGDYDRVQESDSSQGLKARQMVMQDLEDAFIKYLRKHPELDSPRISERGNSFLVSFDLGKFHYQFNLSTINNIVNKNYQRKLDGLRYLPFDSKMDKYNAYYMYVKINMIDEQLSIFDVEDKEPNIVSEKVVNGIIEEINVPSSCFDDYKYVDMVK